jgi:hypothetical protein
MHKRAFWQGSSRTAHTYADGCRAQKNYGSKIGRSVPALVTGKAENVDPNSLKGTIRKFQKSNATAPQNLVIAGKRQRRASET